MAAAAWQGSIMARRFSCPACIPGELVAVEIKRRKKGFLQAELVEIISPSADRIAPPCLGEKQCTGATWPHISYPAQLRYKQEILLDTLKRIGGMEPARPLPILPSPRTDHYRLRTQFNVRVKDGVQRIGFFRQGSYDLIEVEQAFLIHPLIDKVLKGIRSLSNELPLLTEIHINASPAGEAHILLFSEQSPLPPMETFFAKLRNLAPEVIGLTGFAGRKKVFSLGRNRLSLEVEGLALRATEGNFFQVNWEQNRNMVRTVLDFAALTGNGDRARPLLRHRQLLAAACKKSRYGHRDRVRLFGDRRRESKCTVERDRERGVYRRRPAERSEDPDPEKDARRR